MIYLCALSAYGNLGNLWFILRQTDWQPCPLCVVGVCVCVCSLLHLQVERSDSQSGAVGAGDGAERGWGLCSRRGGSRKGRADRRGVSAASGSMKLSVLVSFSFLNKNRDVHVLCFHQGPFTSVQLHLVLCNCTCAR